MRIGFLNNQIDNRGTGNAMFDYAHYNEKILGNQSVIFTYQNGQHDQLAVERYQKRFGSIYNPEFVDKFDLDALYHIKSGQNDGAFESFSPYLVHSVFDNDPHGTIYATISPWMAARYNLPFVPHIIDIPRASINLRSLLHIPVNAVVFGRHGGYDTFDIPWVWGAIKRLTEERDDVWFLLLNTAIPNMDLNEHIVQLAPTSSPENKASFIEACDAMIHARTRGETFGIAVGEFASLGRPVVTYGESPERAHIEELEENALLYSNEQELYDILDGFMPLQDWQPKYVQYSPEIVMAKFREVFLDGINSGDSV